MSDWNPDHVSVHRLTFAGDLDWSPPEAREFSAILNDDAELERRGQRIGVLEARYRHYFVPRDENDRFCRDCGEYLTSQLHHRADTKEADHG